MLAVPIIGYIQIRQKPAQNVVIVYGYSTRKVSYYQLHKTLKTRLPINTIL
nr:MAG TPA: hypothetical protein [Caudoviricetes sp.]